MKELIHTYGEHRNLQGIASLPEKLDSKRPAVLLLNAGVVHKVGPFDFNVSFARLLSADDYLVFRFDLNGMGDSAKIKDGSLHNESVMNDIKATLSFLQSQYGIDQFVVIGLCTGADHAHKIACEDSRVIGNVWLDGYGYTTWKFTFLRLLPVLLNPKRLAFAIINRIKNRKQLIKKARGVNAYVWELPEKEKYLNDMQLLDKRGFKCLYIYSGGVKKYYNYKNQFNDSFKGQAFLKNIDVEYYPQFDHTYTILKDRQQMMARVNKWLNTYFS